MHLAYGTADESGCWARQVYKDQYPQQKNTAAWNVCMHRNLCERGSLHSNMQDTGRRWLMRTVNIAEVLHSIKDNLNTSTRAISLQAWGLSVISVADTAREMCASLPSAKDAVTATRCISEACGICTMVHTERCHGSHFSSFCLVYRWSFIHLWRYVQYTQFTCLGLQQPTWYQKSLCATSLCINVRAGVIGDYLLGSYLLPYRLEGQKYPIFPDGWKYPKIFGFLLVCRKIPCMI